MRLALISGWIMPLAGGAADSGTALEEVVVTAQKSQQDAQQIGVAVSVVSGDSLQAERIQQPLTLASVVSSLATMNATSDATPLFLIRGVGLDDFNTNNSSGVGTYLDEVFAGFPGFLTEALFDIDRVEVLKGPQGTLYGKNTAGGAINILSRQPTDRAEGYIDLSYGRWDILDATAAISGKLADGIKARLAATMTKQGEGYQTDIDSGQKYGRLDRGGARALVDVRISDTATLQLNLHAAYDHSLPSSPSTPDVEALVPASPFPTNGLLNSPAGGTLVRIGGLPLYKDENSAGSVAKLKLLFDGMTLTSISAFDGFYSHSLDNYDGYPAADNNWRKNFRQTQVSEEIRLASDQGVVVDWILGADYSQNWYRCQDSLDWTFVYGLADSITDSGKAVTATNFTQRQQSEGLYAHAETHLSARWTLVTGLRFSRDSVSFNGVTLDPTGELAYAANGSESAIIPNTVLAKLDQTRNSQDFSFRLEADDHLTDKAMLYASLATAYKAGIFYGQPAQVQVDWGYVRPEHVVTSEFGGKSRFFGDSLQIDMALFDTVLFDRQSSLSLWAGPVGTQPLIAGLGNVPRSRIDGAESEVAWRPLSGFEIRAGATYLQARVSESLTSDNGLALYTPVRIGQSLPDAPRLSGNGALRYSTTLTGDLALYGQVNDHYTGSEHPYLGDPTSFGRGHALGARIGIKDQVQHWDLSLWGSNLTDSRPLTYAFAGSEGQRVSFYQKPVSVGMNLIYSF